jgi:hypothetical protein
VPKSKKPRKAYRPDRRYAGDRVPSLLEMHALFTPIFKTLDDLASGEVEHDKGIPIMLFDGEWAAIHAAMIGWACCWERICSAQGMTYDATPLRKLAKKLENGVMLEVEDIERARDCVELTRKVFMKTPAHVLKRHSVTEQIAIEFEKRNLIQEAA